MITPADVLKACPDYVTLFKADKTETADPRLYKAGHENSGSA